MTKKIDIHISDLGFTRHEEGEKRIVACVHYKGNRKVYVVYYYDKAYDRLSHTKYECCQSPTFARTEAGALRQIRKFFNS